MYLLTRSRLNRVETIHHFENIRVGAKIGEEPTSILEPTRIIIPNNKVKLWISKNIRNSVVALNYNWNANLVYIVANLEYAHLPYNTYVLIPVYEDI